MSLSRLQSLLPNLAPVSGRERLRASIGVLLGVFLTGAISAAALGTGAA